jgi:hypothetical protein
MKIKMPLSQHFLTLALAIFASAPALAQEGNGSAGSGGRGGPVFNFFPERQSERRQSRWSLDSWLKQKREIEKQNLWLWQHTNKIPFEFAAGFALDSSRYAAEVDAYVARLGLRLRYAKEVSWLEDAASDAVQRKAIGGAVQLRLFGGNLQDTNLIVRGGYDSDHVFEPLGSGLTGHYPGAFAGGELQIYFAQWLGVRGEWQQHFKRKNQQDRYQELAWTDWNASAFIEMRALRLEGGWRQEDLRFSGARAATRLHENLFGRVKLFY